METAGSNGVDIGYEVVEKMLDDMADNSDVDNAANSGESDMTWYLPKRSTRGQTVGETDELECDVCGKVLKTKAILRRHMKIHTGDKPYECNMCKSRFTRSENLKVHMRLHTGERPYKCEKCDFKSTDKTSLTKHLRVHLKTSDFKCSKCDFTSPAKGALVSHIIGVHSKLEAFMCRFCSYGFSTDHELNAHVTDDHPEAKHLCQTCGKRFTSKAFLERHTLSHTGEKPHKCTVCARAFTRAETLRDHMETHLDENEKTMLQCDHCDYKCRQSQKLKRHVASRHATKATHSCSVCSFGGNSEEDVDKHIKKNHQDDVDATIVENSNQKVKELEECNICGKEFTQRANLKRHMMLHVGVKAFECEECGESFSRNSNLQSHYSKVHGREPTEFTCRKCRYKAPSRELMDEHMESAHKPERTYSCQVCGEFSTTNRLDLIAHASEKHKVAYSFFCKYCGIPTKTKESLLDHISTEHGSSQVHECEQCGDRFLRRSSYVRHVRTQHLKERPYECIHCGLTFDRREKLLRHVKTHGLDETAATEAERKRPSKFATKHHKVSVLSDMEGSENSVTQNGSGGDHEDGETTAGHVTMLTSSPAKKLISSYKSVDRTVSQGSRLSEFSCTTCDKPFSSKRSLARHMAGHQNRRAVDSNTPITENTECEHKSYRTHNQIHHCVECGDTFSRRGAMNRHYRTVHLLIKAYKCEICQKAFTRQDTLKSHMQNHTDFELKDHRCIECKMGFESEFGLRIHMKLLHKSNSKEGASQSATQGITLIGQGSAASDNELVAVSLPLDTVEMIDDYDDDPDVSLPLDNAQIMDDDDVKDVDSDNVNVMVRETMDELLETLTHQLCD